MLLEEAVAVAQTVQTAQFLENYAAANLGPLADRVHHRGLPNQAPPKCTVTVMPR
jgi:hypothetical protein